MSRGKVGPVYKHERNTSSLLRHDSYQFTRLIVGDIRNGYGIGDQARVTAENAIHISNRKVEL
jgi:hypothetical protein